MNEYRDKAGNSFYLKSVPFTFDGDEFFVPVGPNRFRPAVVTCAAGHHARVRVKGAVEERWYPLHECVRATPAPIDIKEDSHTDMMTGIRGFENSWREFWLPPRVRVSP